MGAAFLLLAIAGRAGLDLKSHLQAISGDSDQGRFPKWARWLHEYRDGLQSLWKILPRAPVLSWSS